jgi:very-short-patch-repair endonuclease
MSLTKNRDLINIAKMISRDLRKNSTNTEKLLWNKLRDKRFSNKKFRRLHPIFHDISGKESFFVGDFYCNESKLIIELDGIIHKLKKDKLRMDILNDLGLRVVRFSNTEVENNLEEVFNKIKKLI